MHLRQGCGGVAGGALRVAGLEAATAKMSVVDSATLHVHAAAEYSGLCMHWLRSAAYNTGSEPLQRALRCRRAWWTLVLFWGYRRCTTISVALLSTLPRLEAGGASFVRVRAWMKLVMAHHAG